MISAQIETIIDTLDELKPYFPIHWKQLGLFQNKMPLDPDYDEYLRRDALGMWTLATVRDDGNLVGYVVFSVARGMHYKSTLVAIMDSIFLEDSTRGHGHGRLLGETALAELKRRGVGPVYGGSKNHKGIEGFWRSLGMEPVETVLAMWIGD